MPIRMLAAASALSVIAGAASAVTFTLDFGNFAGQSGNTLQYNNVASAPDGMGGTTDLFATIDLGPNYVQGGGFNGESNGDAKINVLPGRTFDASLNLFEDASFTQAYNPMGSFDWAITIYDIDTNRAGDVVESVTLRSGGTVTSGNNPGSPTLNRSGTTFDAAGVGPVPNPAAGTTSLTPAQENVALLYRVSDRSTIDLTFGVTGSGNGRNILIDGGEIEFEGETLVTPIPLPAGLPLMALGLGAIAFLRRKG